MKILFVSPHYKPHLGGVERAIQKLSAEYRSAGHDVCVVTTHWDSSPKRFKGLPDIEQDQGVQIVRVNETSRGFLPVSIFLLPYFFNPAEIIRIIDMYSPDIIHLSCDCWWYMNLALAIHYQNKTPIVFSPAYHPLSWRLWWKRIAVKMTGQKAAGVIALTQQEKNHLKDLGIGDKKIFVRGYGVDSIFDKNMQERKKTLPFTFLYVGRLEKSKGQIEVIELFNKYKNTFHTNANLVLIGNDLGYGKSIVQMRERSPWKEDIYVLQDIDDDQLKNYYNRCHIFVSASRYESFGLAIFEALSAGLPIIIRDYGHGKELFGECIFGFLEENTESLLQKIYSLEIDKEKFASLSSQISMYTKKFEWHNVSSVLLEYYKSLIHFSKN